MYFILSRVYNYFCGIFSVRHSFPWELLMYSKHTQHSYRRAATPMALSRLAAAFLGLSFAAAVMAQTNVPPVVTNPATAAFGSYYKPYAADSLWNSRPVNPVFGSFVIPKSNYFPAVAAGAYSTGAFLAAATDPAMEVFGMTSNPKGIWDQDAESFNPSVKIPHWPAGVTPAAGSDGHADIIDEATGIVHSFWYLRKDATTGRWSAASYAWSPLAGRGWGDAAHYYQGARAVGVPPLAGLIRKHEIKDGKAIYNHALAISLTYNGLSAKPTYIFPATSADSDAATTNTGGIPEGALLMLPANYDSSKIANADLKKVVDTLKVYGGYVVDRNYGTPFNIYVENGSGFELHKQGWDNAVAAELDRMRAALRQVVSATGYIDGNGKAVLKPATLAPMTMKAAPQEMNLLSMRGNGWYTRTGPIYGVYNTQKQAIVFPATTAVQGQVIGNRRNIIPLQWNAILPGEMMKLTAVATGGGKLQVHLRDGNGKTVYDSGMLGNGESVRFAWPATVWTPYVFVYSGIGPGSTVSGELVRAPATTTATATPTKAK